MRKIKKIEFGMNELLKKNNIIDYNLKELKNSIKSELAENISTIASVKIKINLLNKKIKEQENFLKNIVSPFIAQFCNFSVYDLDAKIKNLEEYMSKTIKESKNNQDKVNKNKENLTNTKKVVK